MRKTGPNHRHTRGKEVWYWPFSPFAVQKRNSSVIASQEIVIDLDCGQCCRVGYTWESSCEKARIGSVLWLPYRYEEAPDLEYKLPIQFRPYSGGPCMAAMFLLVFWTRFWGSWCSRFFARHTSLCLPWIADVEVRNMPWFSSCAQHVFICFDFLV